MFSTVSGLGRLFNSAAATLSAQSPKPQRQYDSAMEEFVTYDLLYPHGETLHQDQHHAYPIQHTDAVSSSAKVSDDTGGMNIEPSRDVRIIVAQKAHEISRVLYDSHPPPPFSAIRAGPSIDSEANGHQRDDFPGGLIPKRNSQLQKSHTAPHTRQSSLSQTAQSIFTSSASPLPSVSEVGGLFGSSKMRSGIARPASSEGESIQTKIAREEREETDALLGCMFGATGLLSVSSTKLHVKPFTPNGSGTSRPPSSGASRSISPRAFAKSRTPLTRSTTAENLPILKSSQPPDSTDQLSSRRKSSSIVITKLFTVDPRDLESIRVAKNDANYSNGEGPSSSEAGSPSKAAEPGIGDKAKQIKTPTFAVAMILYIPPNQRSFVPAFMQNSALSERSNSFENSWSAGASPHMDGPKTDFDYRIDYVLAQWVILVRTLSSLETVTRDRLCNLLAQRYMPTATPSRQTLQLATGSLQQCPIVHKAVERTSKRVAAALQIRRVSTGQNRWGVWRGVARGVRKWAGSPEQNFFLLNILTAFLGTHTEWLDLVKPKRNMRHRQRQDRGPQQEADVIKHRTVVLSRDKMAARRIIFLLSIFLPSNLDDSSQAYRREHSPLATNLASSASPPRGIPTSRRQSLRRTMNRNTMYQYSSHNPGSEGKTVSFSSPKMEEHEEQNPGQNQSTYQHSRRSSDTISSRSVALPISSTATRKSSTTTTATVIPDPTVAIPRFSPFMTEPAMGTSAEPRPGSSGSLAALSLQRTLSRSESNGYSSMDSQTIGRWGSTRSDFWSTRRGSSTENSDLLASSEEGLGISGVPKDLQHRSKMNDLARMVEELDFDMDGKRSAHMNKDASSSCTDKDERDLLRRASPSKQIQHSAVLEPFPLTLSVDEKDGVIDVELPPTASYSSSFASTISSSHPTRTTSSSLNDHSFTRSPHSGPRPPSRLGSDSVVSVAGWLSAYHPDFALQGVRPYDNLKKDVKQSMRSEPTPPSSAKDQTTNADAWTEVCSTVIADMTNFTVTRLTLRRKNACSPLHQARALYGDRPGDNPHEEIIEERVVDFDPMLTDALERVISHSGQSSHAPSRAPSPPRPNPKAGEGTPAFEIPRSECNKIIFGALVHILKSVRAETSDADFKDKDVSHDNVLREGVRRWLKQRAQELG